MQCAVPDILYTSDYSPFPKSRGQIAIRLEALYDEPDARQRPSVMKLTRALNSLLDVWVGVLTTLLIQTTVDSYTVDLTFKRRQDIVSAGFENIPTLGPCTNVDLYHSRATLTPT